MIELSSRYLALKTELASVEEELRELVGEQGCTEVQQAATVEPASGSASEVSAPAAVVAVPEKSVDPVTARVRRLLAGSGPLSFSAIYDGVLRGGRATKYAVRAALQKGRHHGELVFDPETSLYEMAKPIHRPAGKPKTQKTPEPVKARGSAADAD